MLNAALRFAVGARDSTQNEKGKETESSSGAWLDFRVSTFPSIRFVASSRQNEKENLKAEHETVCPPPERLAGTKNRLLGFTIF